MKPKKTYLVRIPVGSAQLGALFKVVNGEGGYQTLFRRLQEQVFLELDFLDLGRLQRAKEEDSNGRSGGFQRRARALLDGDSENLFGRED